MKVDNRLSRGNSITALETSGEEGCSAVLYLALISRSSNVRRVWGFICCLPERDGWPQQPVWLNGSLCGGNKFLIVLFRFFWPQRNSRDSSVYRRLLTQWPLAAGKNHKLRLNCRFSSASVWLVVGLISAARMKWHTSNTRMFHAGWRTTNSTVACYDDVERLQQQQKRQLCAVSLDLFLWL